METEKKTLVKEKKVSKKKTTKNAEKSKCVCSMTGMNMWMGVAGILLVLFIISLTSAGFTDWSGWKIDRNEGVDLYIMSQCPYGVQAENTIIPQLKEFEGVDLNIYYIMEDLGDGNFDSLHGEPEVLGAIAQLCVKEYSPESYFDFILCQNSNAGAIPDNWQDCVSALELDADKIGECYSGDEGRNLLSDNVAQLPTTQMASPTIYVNGEEYKESRDGFVILQEVCNGKTSSACLDLPECLDDSHCVAESDKVGICTENVCSYQEPVAVDMYLLNDKTCANCDPTTVVGYMNEWFKGLNVIEVDTDSVNGKELIDELGIVYAPGFIFSDSIVNTYLWASEPDLGEYYFEKTGDYYKLKDAVTGASWFVDEAKKKEHFDSLGITLGDNKPTVNFFVMSYCPYGNIAEEAMYEVYKNLGDAVEFVPGYVFYSNYGGGGPNYCLDSESKYCSMHGVQEANQDIRELCVYEEYGIESWFEFTEATNAACDSQNVDACWSGVASELGFDTGVISTCETSRGLELAAEQFSLAEKFGAQGSPYVFVDGVEVEVQSISASEYQNAICAGFDEMPSACGEVVQETVQQPVSGSC